MRLCLSSEGSGCVKNTVLRVAGIVLVVGLVGFLGCWLCGVPSYSPWPLTKDFFPVAPAEVLRSDIEVTKTVSDGSEAVAEAGGLPFWPGHVTLLQRQRLSRTGVDGAIFTVDGSKRQEVVDYYRRLLLCRGWHEMSSGEKNAAEVGLSAEGLHAFVCDGGMFFLGYNADASQVHFVTMHLPRRSN